MMRRAFLLMAVLGLIILSFTIPAVSAYGPKHIRVTQTQVNQYLKQMKTYNGPNFQWPKGSQINFTCGSSGCAFELNEKATQGVEQLMALGVGIAGVATAILALTGVGIPAAAAVGLVVAMFTATGAWIAVADWWGGNIGIYGSYWLGSLLFTIWCNPVPSGFLTQTSTTTSTTDPVTSTTTYSQSTTYRSSSQTTTSSTTTSLSTSMAGSSTCYIDPVTGNCLYGPSH
jgi:subtilisin-like proprotein convertase family protein